MILKKCMSLECIDLRGCMVYTRVQAQRRDVQAGCNISGGTVTPHAARHACMLEPLCHP